MLGEWYLPPGKCQAISTITEGIISISHPAPLSSQTRIPQTSSPLVDKSQATQATSLQIRRSDAGVNAQPWPDREHDRAPGPARDHESEWNGAGRDVWFLDTTHAIGRRNGSNETCPSGELS